MGAGGRHRRTRSVGTSSWRDIANRLDLTVDSWFEKHLRGRPWLDRLMYGASAAGEHSLVWLAWGGLEGWRSGHGWRPLARAGAALGAESLLVNGLVKSAFRRHRPVGPEQRPLPLRIPRTSSFPSGHASAAFFAAALIRGRRRWRARPASATRGGQSPTLENGVTGGRRRAWAGGRAPVQEARQGWPGGWASAPAEALPYLIAVVVASSRVHVRVHHASDIIAGALLGAALGEVAARMRPLVPPVADEHLLGPGFGRAHSSSRPCSPGTMAVNVPL
ncbi:MAG: phosphatase PAP2 family protein [Acidimicrobiales bacterium]